MIYAFMLFELMKSFELMNFLDDYPNVIERQNDEILNASETPERNP